MGQRLGIRKSPLYNVWAGMKQRCFNKKTSNYRWYGARGVTISEAWLSYESFYIDMSPTYEKGLRLERRDNLAGYSKENCVWATHKKQMRNQRSNIFLTYKGETYILADWAEKLGMKYGTLYTRVVTKKIPVQAAFERPNRYAK